MIPALRHRPRGAGGLPAHGGRAASRSPQGSALLEGQGVREGVWEGVREGVRLPAAPCPTQPGRPSSPRHKAHCPYSFGLCSHMANPCRHSQHPFIQAHNVPQQGTIGTLFASIIDANGRHRERERRKNHLTIRDIQLIMNHMCL